MAVHFDLLGTFRSVNSGKSLDLTEFDSRLMEYRLLLKCADVSHPTKPSFIHEKWSKRICEEFFRQGDREKALGLPVSLYCDRDNVDLPEVQIGFVANIVSPLFEAVLGGGEGGEGGQWRRNLRDNVKLWEGRKGRRGEGR